MSWLGPGRALFQSAWREERATDVRVWESVGGVRTRRRGTKRGGLADNSGGQLWRSCPTVTSDGHLCGAAGRPDEQNLYGTTPEACPQADTRQHAFPDGRHPTRSALKLGGESQGRAEALRRAQQGHRQHHAGDPGKRSMWDNMLVGTHALVPRSPKREQYRCPPPRA